MATSAAENGYEIHLWSKPVSRESDTSKNRELTNSPAFMARNTSGKWQYDLAVFEVLRLCYNGDLPFCIFVAKLGPPRGESTVGCLYSS
jgi:hypothetical protein